MNGPDGRTFTPMNREESNHDPAWVALADAREQRVIHPLQFRGSGYALIDDVHPVSLIGLEDISRVELREAVGLQKLVVGATGKNRSFEQRSIECAALDRHEPSRTPRTTAPSRSHTTTARQGHPWPCDSMAAGIGARKFDVRRVFPSSRSTP